MTQETIEQLVANLLLSTERPLHFPTDLKKVAQKLNASIVKSNLRGESGYILQYKNHFLICIDTKNHRVTHNRFTIAHELSHIALGHLDKRKHIPYVQKEQEANDMAGALLMPFHFMVAYRDYETRILSGFMAVSEQAMDIRRKQIIKDRRYHIAVQRNYYKDNLNRDIRGGI